MASRAKKKSPRSRIRGYMFDLDGTLVLGDRSGKSYDVLPGAIETLASLKKQGIPYVVLTNGSAQPPPSQAAKNAALPGNNGFGPTPAGVGAPIVAGYSCQSADRAPAASGRTAHTKRGRARMLGIWLAQRLP